ncbi:MAG: S9 family peptidase, partial [Sphingobacteriales bacterium]
MFLVQNVQAQFDKGTIWSKDGYSYYKIVDGGITVFDINNTNKKKVLVSKEALTTAREKPINIRRFTVDNDGKKILISTNTKKVWRYDTRGDYWLYDVTAKTLRQLGANLPASSLMFAKLSPDGTNVAYVSQRNIYMEDLASGDIKALTTDGTSTLINGTFDWAYEEEFQLRDGFKWSPDGKSIAYWQIDASKIKKYLMYNTIDSGAYSFTVPVEYPTAGEDPSACKIGVVNIAGGTTKWMQIPGDNVQHYITLMHWTNNPSQLIVQQLNRAQNQSRLITADAKTGTAKIIYTETDAAWVDHKQNTTGLRWINNGKEFIWSSEQDGWRHLYRINLEGKQQLITTDNFDVISVLLIDEPAGYIYFTASPDNATQRYLYKVKLTGGRAERVTPAAQPGTHEYVISPNGKMAMHRFLNTNTKPQKEYISL